MKKSKHFLGHILAILTAIVWGTSFISTKQLLTGFTPFEILFLRFTIGYVALWVIYPHRLKLIDFKTEFLIFLAGFSGVTIYFLAENYALTYTYASNVSLLVSVAPLLTGLLAHFILKDRLKKNFIVGFFVAIIGIALISFSGATVLKLNPKGDLLAIGAALLWAIYSIAIHKVGGKKINTLALTRRIFFYGLVTMIPCAFFLNFSVDKATVLIPSNLFNLLYLGVISSAICYITWNKAMEILGAVVASTYIYVIPVVTVIFSFFILKEQITIYMILGIILILGGLYLSQEQQKKTGKRRK
ncbi:MAG: DMT family transporter [Lachnospiraceae bacterium]|nr:DMT family transporter [Lachnospiraceae bacterium]